MRHAFLIFLLALSACDGLPQGGDGKVLAIGDSIMAWNRGEAASIPDVVEKRTGLAVVNASVPGAGMLTGGVPGAVGFSIPGQYRARDWDAVVINGGANDLRNLCGCLRCDAVLDRLISRDASTGAYPALLARIDAPVVLVGYYGPVRGGGGGFDGCADELKVLGARLSQFAATASNVTFVSVRNEIAGQPEFYDTDKVHPSTKGSARIGALVAARLVAITAPAR